MPPFKHGFEAQFIGGISHLCVILQSPPFTHGLGSQPDKGNILPNLEKMRFLRRLESLLLLLLLFLLRLILRLRLNIGTCGMGRRGTFGNGNGKIGNGNGKAPIP